MAMAMQSVGFVRVSPRRPGLRPGDLAIGARIAAAVFRTDLGWMGVAGRDEELAQVVFGYPSRERAERTLASRVGRRTSLAASHGSLESVVDLLTRYAAGEAVDFSDVSLALDHLTPLARRIVAACRSIPRGEVISYGELASACGAPGAARAVGSVMAQNRHPLVVPCHRVVAADGSLGGYSAPDGLRMKRRLLALEGAPLGNVRAGV
jgi:methylated-DNA-[protein]-cysteine S-methyltransferase